MAVKQASSRSRALVLLSFSLLRWGCATRPPPPPPAPLQLSEFQIFRGDSLIASERVTRYVDRLEGDIELTGRARAEYVALLDDSARVRRIESQLRPWEGASFGNAVSYEFVGDSIFSERTRPVASTQRRGGGPAMPYLHPSPGLLEQIVRRAIRLGGSPVELRVWFLTNNTPTVAKVSFVSTRIVDVELAGASIRVWLDEFGILLAEVPSLGWLIQRRRGDGSVDPRPH